MNQILAAFIFFTRLPFWKIKSVPDECFKHVVSYWSFSGWLTGGIRRTCRLLRWLWRRKRQGEHSQDYERLPYRYVWCTGINHILSSGISAPEFHKSVIHSVYTAMLRFFL